MIELREDQASTKTSFDMEPILNQERLFFELTKLIMNQKDLAIVDLKQMHQSTRDAFDFMRTMLTAINTTDDRWLTMYS